MTVAGPSDERALASLLAASEDEPLADLFIARRLVAPAAAHDFFDVAAVLLSDASVDKALTRLGRVELAALAEAADTPVEGASRDVLARLALLDADDVPFAAVRARLAKLAPDASFTVQPVPSPGPADAADAAASAERTFDAVASLADVLISACATPLARTGAGSVTATERRRLVEDGAVADGDQLDDLVALGVDAGLLHGLERSWSATDETTDWLDASTTERWAHVATSFVRALPTGIRTAEGVLLPIDAWHDAYPLDAEWPARAASLARRGRLWGVLADTGLLPWSAGLVEGGEPDTDALARALPPEVDSVYLQADLSAISPGPLAPRLEQRLRRMAVRETRAQASTYRFSAESLTAAVSAGETAQSIHAFLDELSLTGVPQPLAYLIDTTAARHGLIRVTTDPETGRTLVRSTSPQSLATIAVDQALRPVGLVSHGDDLVSRAARDTVYWSLVDARYPVVAVDEGDRPLQVSRRVARAHAPETEPREQYGALIAALRDGQATDSDAAWLERELEQAVRARTVVDVTVRLPDGSARVFVLEATGLGGGRLRGLDRAADVERTLPLTSIESVTPH